jgi:hypothetical protein
MKRFALWLVAIVCVVAAARMGAQAPMPGRNTNMVSGTSWPQGDPFLQRQNEPSMAVSTRNPLHLLAGANDYRTVDIPGLPEGRVTGDAWLGVFKSVDGGLTWRSTLLPGYPQDTSAAGARSPIKGFAAAADPTVRAGTNGLLFFSGIAFDRTVSTTSRVKTEGKGRMAARAKDKQYTAADPFGASAVFIARFIDNNNRPTGDPIDYVDTRVVKSSPGSTFLDKPWLALDIPRFGAPTCTIPATANAPAQSFAGGRAYLAFAEVEGTGAATRSRIMFSRSVDCGKTWSAPVEVSVGHRINQGATIAVDHLTGSVYVAWRRFTSAADGQLNAIHIVKSTNGGASFTTPIKVAAITPFDQGTSAISMRSSAYPTLAIDSFGRPYVAWSQRGVGPNGDARIVIARSNGLVSSNASDDDDFGKTKNDAMSWAAPVAVDNPPLDSTVPTGRGHQIMPSMSFAAGRLSVLYYNVAFDHTRGLFERDPITGAMVETRAPTGDLPGSPDKVFSPYLAEAVFAGTDPITGAPQFTAGLSRRHTVDVWVAQASQFAFPTFVARRLSEYRAGSRTGSVEVEQMQYNPPLLPLFACGTSGVAADCRPFLGDYIDLTPSPAFRTDPFGIWIPNFLPLDTAVFHAVWADNRDVRAPADGNWANYTPPLSAFSRSLPGTKSLFDPTATRPACTPSGEGLTTAGMRNQNIYTARVTRGLFVSAVDNSKQLGGIQRAFAISVQNATELVKSYRLRLRFNSTVQASFQQFTPLTTIDVTIPARSTAARTVFVSSGNRRSRVTVDVIEISAPGGTTVSGGLFGELLLNPDITNPDITNPDITNAEAYNPDITNPDITNPDITNPDITNPDITNPDITNPDITNPDITNPDITNPDITNPDITNPDITNPDITNPDITNGALTDYTWGVSNQGTTSASYTVKLLLNGAIPPGIKVQLVLHRVYKTPIVVDCELGEQSQNVLLANIVNPRFVTSAAGLTNPDITNPDITNATLALAPGESARITLRVIDPDRNDGITFNAAANVSPVVVAQAVNTVDVAQGSTTPPFTTPALVVLAATLPFGVTGAEYPITVLQASGGLGARTWSLAGETSLPPGLTLAPNGTISGTPTERGTFTFIARVTDAATPAHTATGEFTIRTGIGQVLVYGPSLAPAAGEGATPTEATIAREEGYVVDIADAERWSAMTTADFASYNAIIFADPHCTIGTAPLAAAESNRAIWSAATTGPKAVIGTDAQWHVTDGQDPAAAILIRNSIRYAASGATTGFTMSLSCYYHGAVDPEGNGVKVTVLDQFGDFFVHDEEANTVTINSPAHPLMSSLTNETLSNWVSSVHEWFGEFPPSWEVIASETSSGPKPYILAIEPGAPLPPIP